MVSTFSSENIFTEQNLQTSEYQLHGTSFSFVDFLPESTDSGDTFRSLIDKANNWLQANPKYEVNTCESVELKSKRRDIESGKMAYIEYGNATNRFMRGLRLWVTEKQRNAETGQQIGYVNLVPKEETSGASSKRENLSKVTADFNSSVQFQPIPGRIITVESQEVRIRSGVDFDPDCTHWKESGRVHNRFLRIIRIFFEVSNTSPEEIGIMDFIPDQISSGCIKATNKYEPFRNLVQKASDWCSRQTEIKICNAQSLEIKLKQGQVEVDSQKMDHTELENRTTFYIRILRLAYTVLRNQASEEQRITHLTCKTFVPVLIKKGLIVPDFETLKETKERVEAWIKATSARVISAETSAMRYMTGGERKQGTETTFMYNLQDRTEYWIYFIRIYLNGEYQEPPAELLPPIPDVQGCCTII